MKGKRLLKAALCASLIGVLLIGFVDTQWGIDFVNRIAKFIKEEILYETKI